MMVVFCFPGNPNPASKNMNYAVVVFIPSLRELFLKNIMIRSTGSVMFLATTYLYCPKYGGRFWFKGPNRIIDVEGDSGNTTITEKAEVQSSESNNNLYDSGYQFIIHKRAAKYDAFLNEAERTQQPSPPHQTPCRRSS